MDDSEVQDSQEEPTQDSGLQTPQPDQPVPSEEERQAEPSEEGPVQEDRPRKPQYPTNADQEAEYERKEQERQAQRDEHNARTAGKSVESSEPSDADES